MAGYALSALLWAMLGAGVAFGQTTAFTYQGQLTDTGMPANGNFDLQFGLFDNASGGTQIGSTQTLATVPVSGGVFTVQLDFGVSAFSGASRFLEIGVRPAGGGSYTTLAPRQQISSTPYAIRTLSAATADALSSTCVGCVQDRQIQSVAGSKVSGTISVASLPAGSGSYLQNTTTQQTSTNFNISGDGTAGGTLSANIINATTQYNLGGARILSAGGTRNVFVGFSSGLNTTGTDNAFVGASSGQANTTGEQNSFFGSYAGQNNTTGITNSFFGTYAGMGNTEGIENSFFGLNAGGNNTTGSDNAFFGYDAGVGNGVGNRNAFFGNFAGYNNKGSNNTLLGTFADVKSPGNLTNATAIGALARVDQSNSLVLGSVAGVNEATSSVNVGIGTTTPQNTLHVKGSTLIEAGGSGGNVLFGTPNGETGLAIIGTNRGDVRFDGSTLKLVAGFGPGAQPSTNGLAINTAGRVGVGTTSPTAQLEVKGNSPGVGALRVLNSTGFTGFDVRDDRTVVIGQLSSTASSTHVCLDGTSTLSFCTSSLRYKEQITPYSVGLDLIRRLHPISFTWKGNGLRDFGLGAEDVAKVEPLLVTHNNAGQIQGVKYDQLNVVLINAIKQQQTQIEALQAANATLNARLRAVERGVGKQQRLSDSARRSE